MIVVGGEPVKIDIGLNSDIRTKKEHIPRFVKLESVKIRLSLGITFGP